MLKQRWLLLFDPEGHTTSFRTERQVNARFHMVHDPERIVELHMTPEQARKLADELTRAADYVDDPSTNLH